MSRLVLTMTLTAVTMMAGTSWGGRLYISDSATSPKAGVNPTFTLPAIGASSSMYVWAELAAGETIPGLAYDVVNATAGVASGTAHVADNPTIFGISRWNVVNPGTLAELTTGSNFVKVGGGLNGAVLAADPLYDASTNSYRVSRIDFTATAVGSTDVFLAIGTAGIALGGPGTPIFLGWRDASIANNAFGMTSSLADATIVVPESSSLGMFLCGISSLLLVRRWQ